MTATIETPRISDNPNDLFALICEASITSKLLPDLTLWLRPRLQHFGWLPSEFNVLLASLIEDGRIVPLDPKHGIYSLAG